MRKPGIATGALVGAFLTAPLIAVFFLAWKVAGLPFVPFQVFDWTSRLLPGGVITFGIDSMVKVIRALKIADTSSAAKAAEQSMAIGIFLIGGALLGAVLFATLRALRVRRPVLPGIVLGIAAGLGAVAVARSLEPVSTVSREVREGWTLAAFGVWGSFLGLANRRLTRQRIELRGELDRSAADKRIERLDRRSFLVRLGAASATITVAGAAIGSLAGGRRRGEVATGKRWSSDHLLPNSGAGLPPAAGTRPEYTPLEDHYRIDITTTPPVIDGAAWRLKVSGLVERPLELTLEQIRAYEPLHQFVTLACISNPIAGSLIGTTRWTGVSMQRLLPDLRLAPTATHLKLSSADHFYEIVALDTIRSDARVMLAYDWDGVPLTTKHGFPLRIYIPNLYGMKQPKWLQSIEATDHWEPGYWVKRGWDRIARMKATSVIDTISVDMMLAQADSSTRIPIGGIAHAGARGISKAEIRVDDGPWHEARLRTPLSETTWVVWRYDWPFQPGNHTFTVRCFDGAGVAQIADVAPPHPSGASGLHSKSMML
jgi:DMSO/TMAO reductase YedYZ molybdopterin-dependent catalytic subunit